MAELPQPFIASRPRMTVGFPTTVAAFTWVDDVLSGRKGERP